MKATTASLEEQLTDLKESAEQLRVKLEQSEKATVAAVNDRDELTSQLTKAQEDAQQAGVSGNEDMQRRKDVMYCVTNGSSYAEASRTSRNKRWLPTK